MQITTPLPVGVYRIQLVAVDTAGHDSRPSRPFLIKVVPNRRLEHEMKVGQVDAQGSEGVELDEASEFERDRYLCECATLLGSLTSPRTPLFFEPSH